MQKKGMLQNISLKKMLKTRNLFGVKTAQKRFRVSDFVLFPCANCYRIFILQQPFFSKKKINHCDDKSTLENVLARQSLRLRRKNAATATDDNK